MGWAGYVQDDPVMKIGLGEIYVYKYYKKRKQDHCRF